MKQEDLLFKLKKSKAAIEHAARTAERRQPQEIIIALAALQDSLAVLTQYVLQPQ